VFCREIPFISEKLCYYFCMKLQKLAVLLMLSICFSACSPKLRIKPGVLPPAEAIDPKLKIEAENFVRAHIDEENFFEIKSGPELKRAKNVVDRLSVAAGYPRGSFPVHLLNAGDQVNAAAFNGASIVVYRELLVRVKTDEELATVLAHEVGHILARHYKDSEEEQSRASAVNTGSSLLGSVASIATSLAGYGGASDLVGDVTEGASGAIGYGAYVGTFSRTQEYEADHLGLIIMAKAGYDPRTAIAFWQRSGEIFGSSQSKAGSFFSTHPAESDRVDALNEAMPYALQYYKK
jgi:predicted Zn-dependent protease